LGSLNGCFHVDEPEGFLKGEFMFKNKRFIKIFATTFFTTIAVAALAGGGVWYAVNNTIRPPELPSIPVAAMQQSPSSVRNTSSRFDTNGLDTDYEPEDALLPPSLLQFEERKPSFFTFLIFGLTEGNHANTVMVAAYDAIAQQGYIISIPRDTRVDFQRNRRKIVAAYLVGNLNDGGHEGGAERMKYEVSTLIGFRPDFYISIDYDAFIRSIDMVGGVEIDVPFHKMYDDPWQNLHINIPAGQQVLDGRNALHFARYRRGNSNSQTITDYQRIKNQQQVLSAVVNELLSPASLLRVPEFISIFNEYVYSDLAMGELAWFASQARHVGGIENLHLYTLPMAGTSGAPHWYELADEAGILELVNRTVNPLVRDITSNDVRIVR